MARPDARRDNPKGPGFTLSLAVLDASAFVRALWIEDAAAETWMERVFDGRVSAVVPDLVHAEVANAFLLEHRVHGARLDEINLALGRFLALPLSVVSLEVIVADALLTADARDLSVYDACYVVLAEANDTVLVTADRKLAAACARSELLT